MTQLLRMLLCILAHRLWSYSQIMDAVNSLKIAAFRNSVRIFHDACILANASRRESALALGVLAYEELGKCLMADRILDLVSMNPGSENWGKESLSHSMRRHKIKILHAAIDSGTFDASNVATWDGDKQAAIYTDLKGGQVSYPTVSTQKLNTVLAEVMRALEEVGDLPYFGIDGESTEKSVWMAKRDVEAVRIVYVDAMSV